MTLKKEKCGKQRLVNIFGRLDQCDNKTGANGKNSLFILTHQEIREILTY